MKSHERTGAIILAGGHSTRMGSNKALLRLRPAGPTLIESVVARLREANLPPTLLVTNTPHDYAFLDIQMVLDDIEGVGALGGILTALSHSTHTRNLIVACDMPLLNPTLLKHMASLPNDNDAILPRWTNIKGRTQVETLHAIYSTRCIEPVRRRIVESKLKVADLLNDISVRYLEEPELRRYDPHLNSFRNINTPGELEAMRIENY
ncbi:MAG TPA: molybdenum cofactor guanylyltransferase [Chloroflexia bacterium]|nr:molybdenum cofactor guanylyltransferase [Chloroflexia bacterium]